jgi:hypothetical protein
MGAALATVLAAMILLDFVFRVVPVSGIGWLVFSGLIVLWIADFAVLEMADRARLRRTRQPPS